MLKFFNAKSHLYGSTIKNWLNSSKSITPLPLRSINLKAAISYGSLHATPRFESNPLNSFVERVPLLSISNFLNIFLKWYSS
jgi:hypothetical protein